MPIDSTAVSYIKIINNTQPWRLQSKHLDLSLIFLHNINNLLQCSVSCGEGVQVRGVECTPAGGGCDPGIRPEISRPCSTGISCPAYREASDPDVSLRILTLYSFYYSRIGS